MSARAARHFQLLGWMLFMLSACAYIASSLRSGDGLGVIGGVLFLVACLAFVVPFLIASSPE